MFYSEPMNAATNPTPVEVTLIEKTLADNGFDDRTSRDGVFVCGASTLINLRVRVGITEAKGYVVELAGLINEQHEVADRLALHYYLRGKFGSVYNGEQYRAA